jgi:PKD repeat protein
MLLVLVLVLTVLAHTAQRPASHQRIVSRTAALRLLLTLPVAGQSVISRTLGASQASFYARRTSLGYQLDGGGVRAHLSSAGVSMSTDRGSLSMALSTIGRGGRPAALAGTAPHASANRVSYSHTGVAQWYAAGPLGIEQGFTLTRRPAGHSGPVTLALKLGGSLRATRSGSQVEFVGPSGRTMLRYGGLSVSDAQGRHLHAWLVLSGRRLLIKVTDTGARYPLRIDPFIQQGAPLTEFSASVALAADGDTALIGEPRYTGGSVWVFTRSGSTWTQQGPQLTGTGESAEGKFGNSVALSADGDTALIGAPAEGGDVGAAWVFTRSGSTWTQQGPKLTGTGESGEGEFGASVALSADGETALVGSPADYDNAGAAWVFTRSGSTWTQQGAKLVANDESELEHSLFGVSVALAGNGDTALIGGWGDDTYRGAAWVFTRSGSTWTQQGEKLTAGQNEAWFGWSVALSEDGNTALIGAVNTRENGAAWVFTRSGSTWTLQQELELPSGERSYSDLGYAVALSSDGDMAVVSSPTGSYENNGTAWVFIRSGSTWTQQETPLEGTPTEYSGVRFGEHLALSADGETALVGGTGAAWVEATTSQISSPPSLSFGSQPIGQQGPVIWLEVRDAGSAPLTPLTFSGGAQITGADAADFTIPSSDDRCAGATVPPGETCEIGVRFTAAITGSRSATLTLGPNNTGTATPTVELSGTGVGPSPAFSISPNPGTAGELVSFDASDSSDSDGSIESYSWSFGDGTTAEGIAPTHTYATSGTYTVTLTVDGSSGLTGKITHSVIIKKAQHVEFTSTLPGSAAVGDSAYRVTAEATSGLEVSFSSATLSTCTVTGSTVSFLAMGTCTIEANQAGDSEYAPAADVLQSLTVLRSQSIAFNSTAPNAAKLGGPAYSASTTASSGLAVSLSSGTPSVCSVVGSKVGFVGVGICTIDANQAGSTEYAAAAQAQQSFAIGRGSQVIAFLSSAPDAATVGGTAYAVASASSGFAVSFASTTTSVCTVAGQTVALIGVGMCTIDADQAGDSEYEAAPQVQQSFAVAPAPTLTPSSPATLPLDTMPGSRFTLSGNPAISPKTGAITFKATTSGPGTLSWLITFQSRKPTRPAKSKATCGTRQIEVDGNCSSVKIIFGEASRPVAGAGTVAFTVTPSASAKAVLKQLRGLSLTAILTFRSTLGGAPVSRTLSITVKLKTTGQDRG